MEGIWNRPGWQRGIKAPNGTKSGAPQPPPPLQHREITDSLRDPLRPRSSWERGPPPQLRPAPPLPKDLPALKKRLSAVIKVSSKEQLLHIGKYVTNEDEIRQLHERCELRSLIDSAAVAAPWTCGNNGKARFVLCPRYNGSHDFSLTRAEGHKNVNMP